MSLDYVKFSNGFEKFMPKEYRDMVEHGPFGKKVTVSQMGSFKEVLEEHPMCAGCAMTRQFSGRGDHSSQSDPIRPY